MVALQKDLISSNNCTATLIMLMNYLLIMVNMS